MPIDETQTGAPGLPTGWRFKVGIALLASMLLLWLLIPIEAALKMSAGAIAATTAGIAIVNKIILLVAVAVMGKSGFRELKGRAFGYVKHLAPATTVGPARHTIGLVMFCLPFVQNLLETWASHIAPQLVANRLWVDLAMDAMLIVSVFVLGGNFWDKIRALFVREARAVFPEDDAGTIPLRAEPVAG